MSELITLLQGDQEEHTLGSYEGSQPPHGVESEIVMADGDYAAETDTLKLMKR